jgi:cell division protein FtsI (penicillin-binding protein 3)
LTAQAAIFAGPRPAHKGRPRIVDYRRNALLQARLRALLVGGAFVAVAAIAVLRIGWLGVVQPAPAQASMAEALLPPRGELTDRNGVPLARAFPAYALWYNPQAMDDGGSPLVRQPQEVARQLVAIFPDLDEVELVE